MAFYRVEAFRGVITQSDKKTLNIANLLTQQFSPTSNNVMKAFNYFDTLLSAVKPENMTEIEHFKRARLSGIKYLSILHIREKCEASSLVSLVSQKHKDEIIQLVQEMCRQMPCSSSKPSKDSKKETVWCTQTWSSHNKGHRGMAIHSKGSIFKSKEMHEEWEGDFEENKKV